MTSTWKEAVISFQGPTLQLSQSVESIRRLINKRVDLLRRPSLSAEYQVFASLPPLTCEFDTLGHPGLSEDDSCLPSLVGTLVNDTTASLGESIVPHWYYYSIYGWVCFEKRGVIDTDAKKV